MEQRGTDMRRALHAHFPGIRDTGFAEDTRDMQRVS
jgi:hypothetical protein